MPKGLLIIDWDEFEGGVVSWKFPEEIDIPINLVQLLQISHTFSEGLLTIKEDTFHAVSIGNDILQKVIVLILSEYEDENDFYEIVHTLDSVVSDSSGEQESDNLQNQLLRIFQMSQSVFKARDAVLNKLADEVTDLKNKEMDMRQSLEWLIKNASSLEKTVIFILLRFGPMDFEELLTFANKHNSVHTREDLQALIENLSAAEHIRLELDKKYHLLIHYEMD